MFIAMDKNQKRWNCMEAVSYTHLRGWRKVVASPKPVDIKEINTIRTLLNDGQVVVAAGGGGIPVVKEADGSLSGVEAVIDKDFASQRLAELDVYKRQGRGYINILSATKLFHSPKLYSTFLIWMLSRLFETLPEVGDPEKPKLVFFFDEAHLLFKDASKLFLEKVEQVVRLIRSKGVGIYFITQNPQDLPESVLAQLGNRVQHALRAYTPKEMKAIKVAAQSFRPNPDFDTETVITELGTGEALSLIHIYLGHDPCNGIEANDCKKDHIAPGLYSSQGHSNHKV